MFVGSVVHDQGVNLLTYYPILLRTKAGIPLSIVYAWAMSLTMKLFHFI